MMYKRKRRGFSLIELSVVLAIASLILGAGIVMGSDVLTTAKRVQTQERLQTIKAALEAYAKLNDYLPCPALRSETPSGNPTTFGMDPRPGAACSASSPGRKRINGGGGWFMLGAVPVRSLGLPDYYAADAWGRKFNYAVAETALTAYTTATPALAVYRGDRTGTNYAETSVTNRATVPSTPGAITGGYGAVFVVVSYGPNGKGAFNLADTAVETSCATNTTGNENELGNCDEADGQFWDSDYNDTNIVNYRLFDDFIVWGSNERARPPVTTTQPPTCASGCEAWCAPCTSSMPAASPGNMTSGTQYLCKKFITSTSPCQSTCVWAGTITATSRKVVCP